MKADLRNIAVLGVTGLLSAACLALVYREVEPRVAGHRARERAEAVLSVVPGGESFEERGSDGKIFFEVLDARGERAGFALPGSGSGYGGEIRLMVGLDAGGERITGVRILENIETPGLGGRITEDSFLARFTGLDPGDGIAAVRAPRPGTSEVESITGATVSSKAVAEIVAAAAAIFRETSP